MSAAMMVVKVCIVYVVELVVKSVVLMKVYGN